VPCRMALMALMDMAFELLIIQPVARTHSMVGNSLLLSSEQGAVASHGVEAAGEPSVADGDSVVGGGRRECFA
jgi:hypothetical protein